MPKRKKDLIDKRVRLKKELRNGGGAIFPVGSHATVLGWSKGGYLNVDGRGSIMKVPDSALELIEETPVASIQNSTHS